MPEENFWTLWHKGRLTEADTLTIWLGATPSGLTSAHLHHPPIFFMGRMPFLPPNQQCQSSEGNQRIRIREKMLEFSSTVLPAPSPYLTVTPSRLSYLSIRYRTDNKAKFLQTVTWLSQNIFIPLHIQILTLAVTTLCVALLWCDASCSPDTLISHGSTTEKLIEWLNMISWPTVVFALVFCAFLVK